MQILPDQFYIQHNHKVSGLKKQAGFVDEFLFRLNPAFTGVLHLRSFRYDIVMQDF